uniref:Uncharacterized protein n=1 Tax=Romanomermis culicivorax TaxID=13658 RepID=A0A915KT15_ROMCU
MELLYKYDYKYNKILTMNNRMSALDLLVLLFGPIINIINIPMAADYVLIFFGFQSLAMT